MAVGASHIELYVLGAMCVGVLILLGFILTDTMKVSCENYVGATLGASCCW
jgi:hypothetical protein